MKCKVCGKTIRINWGNSEIRLCEKHQETYADFEINENTKINKYNPVAVLIGKSLALTVILLTFLIILPSTALSFMAFDGGFSWQAISFVFLACIPELALVIAFIYVILC